MSAVARVSRLFGAGGEVSINLYTNFPDDFDWEERPLFTYVDSLVVPLFCESFSRRGAAGATAAFADIDTPKRAEMLVGKELFLATEEETDDEEFTFDDLIGFRVTAGRLEGEVTDFYDNDANPLFEIEIGGRRHLVPAAEEFIAAIDFDRRTMKLVLPEGLLEL